MKKLKFLLFLFSLVSASCSSGDLGQQTPSLLATKTPGQISTPSPQLSEVNGSEMLSSAPLVAPEIRIGTPLPPHSEVITMANANQIRMLAQWGQGVLTDVSYSPDGSLIAMGTSNGVAIYSADNLTRLYFLDTLVAVEHVSISPDNSLVAIASNVSSIIQVWRACPL